MARKRTVVLGLLGPSLDAGKGAERWENWRPSVAVCQHEDLIVDRFELLHGARYTRLAEQISADIETVSPETSVRRHEVETKDPWDFEEVFASLHDFARGYPFDPDREQYLVHITTGTHVAQICLFLLTESHHFPARLLQTSPPGRSDRGTAGEFRVIDLDLSRYDRLASRFGAERKEGLSFLKSGIDTRNVAFNHLIEEIERVALASKSPILLMGPTGAGKSLLARRVYELKRARRQLAGPLVEVNCATLRGDGAMSALFGHEKGAYTGAVSARSGLLRAADKGLLFLDEIAELRVDDQAMLLRAIEDKTFLPVGSDREVRSDFQLIAGTNRDLQQAVRRGEFREDLLARIDLWTFRLPRLRERPEDIEPNLHFELDEHARRTGQRVTFSREALARFLDFARSPDGKWNANFRDFTSSLTRMATLAAGGRITTETVDSEMARLRRAWQSADTIPGRPGILERYLPTELIGDLDRFDRVQLADVLAVCERSRSLSEAGRILFEASRQRKSTTNDADRLRKYLARFDLSWAGIEKAAVAHRFQQEGP